MIAITTSSSIRVNPFRAEDDCENNMIILPNNPMNENDKNPVETHPGRARHKKHVKAQGVPFSRVKSPDQATTCQRKKSYTKSAVLSVLSNRNRSLAIHGEMEAVE